MTCFATLLPEVIGYVVLILFTIGIIAAAFWNCRLCLRTLTTSCCINLLNIEQLCGKSRHNASVNGFIWASQPYSSAACWCSKPLAVQASLIRFMCLPLIRTVRFWDSLHSVVTGAFPRGRYVPYVAIASPVICYLTDSFVSATTSYRFGYVNGLLAFGADVAQPAASSGTGSRLCGRSNLRNRRCIPLHLAIGMKQGYRRVMNAVEHIGFDHGVMNHVFKDDASTGLQFRDAKRQLAYNHRSSSCFLPEQ